MASRKNPTAAYKLPLKASVGKPISRLLDDLNIKIVKELIFDSNISSSDIAAKYNIPLSTVQRRRAGLETSLLKKQYSLDITALGWRQADLLISVEKGNAEETAQMLLENGNVTSASLRIGHPQIDIMARVFYHDSQELHRLTESLKAMPHVTYAEWAEIVKQVGSNLSGMLETLFESK